MKKTLFNKIILMVVFVCFGSVKIDAQCKYNVVNVLNNTSPYSIHCDFPLKANTVDSTIDQNNFNNAFAAWYSNNQVNNVTVLPTSNTTGIKTIYFEIPRADFNLFSNDRQNQITANPQLYRIN